jgi:hypothetical protein
MQRMLSEQVAQQQRQKMRKLRAIFPLRLVPGGAPASAFPHPPFVSICNIKIPTSDDYSGACGPPLRTVSETKQLMVTRFAASLRTDNSPQRKEA